MGSSSSVFIKKNISLAREKLGLSFFTTKQTYLLRFRVSVKNTAARKNSISVSIPVPLETPYQRRQAGTKYRPIPTDIRTDDVFGNEYASWNIVLASNETRRFSLTAAVEVSPRKVEMIGLSGIKHTKVVPKEALLFFRPSTHLQSNSNRIKVLSKTIVRGETDPRLIARKLNRYVVTHLTYGNPIEGLYTSLDALEMPSVDCGGFNTLFISFCIAQHLPARLVSGFWAGYPKSTMHAWAEVLLPEGSWLPVDPSAEHLRTTVRFSKSGRFGFVGSDRIACSIGCDIPLKFGGKTLSVDILQNPIILADRGPTSIKVTKKVVTKRLR